jgi:hypothetical protein
MSQKAMSTRHRESTISFGRSGLGALGVAATLIALSGVAGIDCGGTTLALPEVDASATDDARVPPEDSAPPAESGADATVSDSGTPTDASLADASDAAALQDAADATANDASDATSSEDASDATSSQDASDATSSEDASDATSSQDTGEDAGPWTPSALGSRLAFWFDPTSLVQVGGNVATWSDLSGNGNDAVQGNTAYEPAYNAAGIGGLPSATFNGPITFLAIADNPSMEWGTSDFAVYAVARATLQTVATNAMLYQKTGASPYDGASLYINAGKPFQTTLAAAQVSGSIYVVSNSPPSTFVDSSVHLLGAYRTGATLQVRVDGALSNSITSAAVATVDVSSFGYSAIIGQNGYGIPQDEFQQVHGDIAELVGVNGTLAPAELASLEQYLTARYAIP